MLSSTDTETSHQFSGSKVSLCKNSNKYQISPIKFCIVLLLLLLTSFVLDLSSLGFNFNKDPSLVFLVKVPQADLDQWLGDCGS